MKKLLYFSHGLSANGIEIFLVNVLSRLNLNKYDVTVLIAIDEGVESLHEKTVRDMGVKIINAGDMDSLTKKIKYFKNVKRELKNGNYDIVHANMDLLSGIVLFFAKRAGVKMRICHAHTTKSQYKGDGVCGKIKCLVQKIYAFIMKKLILISSDTFLSCSEIAGEYLYSGKESTVIYNGIDLEKYRSEVETDYAESALNIEKSDKRIISVGRISPVKNPFFALDVIYEFKKIRNDFQYLWVGAGELEEEIKEKSKKLGLDKNVIFTGVRTDVPQLLNCCDCFFMPSLFEGLMISLIEAQAAGLNCVVSDVVPRITDAGLVEYVPLEKSAREWAEIISCQLDTPAKTANSEVLEKFDINYTVKQLEEIYDR